MNEVILTYILIPLLIFCARILDVSLGTIRVIFISKGLKKYAPILGFFEVLIWLVVIKHLITDINHWTGYIAYAAGFAAGTYIGMQLEQRLIHGKRLLRIIVRKHPMELIHDLERNWPLTVVSGIGPKGPVKIIFMILEKEDISNVIQMVNVYNPKAFYSVEDMKYARDPLHAGLRKKHHSIRFMGRKGK